MFILSDYIFRLISLFLPVFLHGGLIEVVSLGVYDDDHGEIDDFEPADRRLPAASAAHPVSGRAYHRIRRRVQACGARFHPQAEPDARDNRDPHDTRHAGHRIADAQDPADRQGADPDGRDTRRHPDRERKH